MDTYNSLLEGGWRMSEIDSMDMLGFLSVRAWNACKEKKKKKPAEHISMRFGLMLRHDQLSRNRARRQSWR